MRSLILALATGLFLAACSSIDCPLNNTVRSIYVLRKASDALRPDTLTDTLTIFTTRADGQDTILLNKSVKTDSLALPMSHVRDVDVLVFELRDTLNHTLRDTLRVKKTNEAHFESVDCALSYFHTITAISSTHHAIDTVVLIHPSVTYDASQPHFHIRFKSGH